MLMLIIFVLLKFLGSYLKKKNIFYLFYSMCLQSIRSELGDLILLIKMYDSHVKIIKSFES